MDEKHEGETVELTGAYAHVTAEGATLEPRGDQQRPFLSKDDLDTLRDKVGQAVAMVTPLTLNDVGYIFQQVQGYPWRRSDGSSAVIVTTVATLVEGAYEVALYDTRNGQEYHARTKGEWDKVQHRIWYPVEPR